MSRNRTFGAIGGPSGIAKKFTAANFALTPEWDIASVDSTAAPVTIGLPQPTDQYPPADGEIYSIVDAGGAAGTNNITVSSAGYPIRIPAASPAASAVIATNGGALSFLFESHESGGEYVLMASNGASSSSGGGGAALSQATWHINPQTGNDANTGLTTGTALKTWAQLESRWKAASVALIGIVLAANVTVTFDASQTDNTDPVYPDVVLGSRTSLTIQGALGTATSTGTFTAVTNPVRASNTPSSVTDSGRANWTADLGQLVQDNVSLTYAWLDVNGSAGVARTSMPVAPRATGPYHAGTLPTESTFTNGHAYSTYSPTNILLAGCNVRHLENDVGSGSATADPALFFSTLSFFAPNAGLPRQISLRAEALSAVLFDTCSFATSTSALLGLAQFSNCIFLAGLTVSESGQSNLFAGLAQNGMTLAGVNAIDADFQVSLGGTTIAVQSPGLTTIGALALMDTSLIQVQFGGQVQFAPGSLPGAIQSIWGNTTAPQFCTLGSGARFYFANVGTAATQVPITSAEFSLGGGTTAWTFNITTAIYVSTKVNATIANLQTDAGGTGAGAFFDIPSGAFVGPRH